MDDVMCEMAEWERKDTNPHRNHCFRITFCDGMITTKAYSYFSADYSVPLRYWVNRWAQK